MAACATLKPMTARDIAALDQAELEATYLAACAAEDAGLLEAEDAGLVELLEDELDSRSVDALTAEDLRPENLLSHEEVMRRAGLRG